MAGKIKSDIITENFKAIIIGPADANIVKVSDIFRRVLYVKALEYEKLVYIKDYIENNLSSDDKIRISFDFNPMNSI